MDRDEFAFSSILFLALVLLLYFIGSSITGLTIQTMYCEEGVCKEFCDFLPDCNDKTKICCDKGGFGVCEDPINCEKSYEFSPEADMQFDISIKQPILESPAHIDNSRIGLTIFLIVLVGILLGVGILHFLKRRK
ncbi:hypothetical protein AYK26_04725 [Euryarchaeota archaeon SM23-78]|nr:MAG: hypothetical protein AYK26_04725 [Euryarchaeota archaeon SM23-78]MBW3001179.1 hypothetical protein [Candidatus Woesearchaeota archaeon]